MPGIDAFSDAAGNIGTAPSQTLHVIDPSITAPQLVLPPPNSGNPITAPLNVTGTITASGSLSWQLSVVSSDGTINKVIASGTSAVLNNGTLGTFDPTLLPNGSYTLKLTATDIVTPSRLRTS